MLTYKKRDPGTSDQKINIATFKQLDLGTQVAELHLVEVPAEGNAATIVAENLAKGRKVILQEELFVSSKVTKVLGFRDL